MTRLLNETPEGLMNVLEHWTTHGWLRPLDLAFTRFIHHELPTAGPGLLLATALASHQLGRGHVCLDLEAALRDPGAVLSLPPDDEPGPQASDIIKPADLLSGLSLTQWLNQLNHPDVISHAEGSTPLVLYHHRLYLRRYWQHERCVEQAIEERLQRTPRLLNSLPSCAELKQWLDTVFPGPSPGGVYWQKIAGAIAARSAFSVITGGPGTGKTTAVVRVLALLQALALHNDQAKPLTIRLAAPTGKAAARLKESISNALGFLPPLGTQHDQIVAAIPSDVSTLHRLLVPVPGTGRFRHDARTPLDVDVMVVDEASMIDLEMMSSLLQALPPKARLIMLGDKDQLASVEAGSVLGGLCQHANQGRYQSDTCEWILTVTGETVPSDLRSTEGNLLDQHIVMLRESVRFKKDSGIGLLAHAVNEGDSTELRRRTSHAIAGVQFLYARSLQDSEVTALWTRQTPLKYLAESADKVAPEALSVFAGYGDYLHAMHTDKPALDADITDFDAWATKVLRYYNRFQLLCALRKGTFGVEGLNGLVEKALAHKGLITLSDYWYEGRPILITRNDYALGLMNGDIGITLSYPLRDISDGSLKWVRRVAFTRTDGQPGIRWVLPSRLTHEETVFAMTVHKSQGSEFRHCALLLPPTLVPVLTRELIYTGITRAKTQFTLINTGGFDVMERSVLRTVKRSGGLFDKHTMQ